VRRFTFLVHPRDWSDVERYRDADPEGVERSLAKVEPLQLTEVGYRDAEGVLVAVPLTTKQMARLPRRYVRQKVLEAACFGIDQGASIIGLGAMTSVTTRGGLWLAEQVNGIVTNGNALTAATVAREVLLSLEPDRPWSLGIVGGSGSVGLCIARLLASRCKELVLVGRSLQTLARAKCLIAGRPVRSTTEVSEVTALDALVVATAGPEPVLCMDQVGERTHVFDLTEPSNVVTREAADRRLKTAGRLKLEGVDLTRYNPGTDPGIAYACLAETILYALNGNLKDHSVGQVDPARARTYARLADDLGMRVVR